MKLSAPHLLDQSHLVADFECGERSLDDWLKRRALTNQSTGASRTFVVSDEHQRVVGYYALAVGAVSHQETSSALRRNMPDPIPVIVLARLAVDYRSQGIKLGAGLLKDAVSRALTVAENAGVRALVVHDLNERAKQFYEHYGFQVSPLNPMTLMLRLN